MQTGTTEDPVKCPVGRGFTALSSGRGLRCSYKMRFDRPHWATNAFPTPNPTFFPHFISSHHFASHLTEALADLGMLDERCIVWGPGAVMLRPNGEVSLDCECIIVPKRIWSSWPLPPKRTSLAESYLRRLTVQGSQLFVQNQPN